RRALRCGGRGHRGRSARVQRPVVPEPEHAGAFHAHRTWALQALWSPMSLDVSQTVRPITVGRAELHVMDCLDWLRDAPERSVAAVVTDPPYGLHEYTQTPPEKLRAGRGGVWRIPPSFDGNVRSPLPRFTTMTQADLEELHEFFLRWAKALRPVLLPGAHVFLACNPLVSPYISMALTRAGLERRSEEHTSE